MDELNKRVLSVMESKSMSKSAFAALIDISLPVLTHIGSGRNKPGLEMIAKILTHFPDISPDWLILGNGGMYRKEVEVPNITKELEEIAELRKKMPDFEQNAAQILNYHQILLKEISYLQELKPYLLAIQNNAQYINQNLGSLTQALESKLNK
ncbi:MAG: hypothetical protein LW669_10670 [Sphingobacteriales bacterium]|nr:hypothetical protein [Sphingobacteriales bacterium]